MPYIEQGARSGIVFVQDNQPYGDNQLLIRPAMIQKPGELNYAITALVKDYLDDKGHSYTRYNEAIGVLECAKLELYRRLVSPYEDEKIKENGDVYA